MTTCIFIAEFFQYISHVPFCLCCFVTLWNKPSFILAYSLLLIAYCVNFWVETLFHIFLNSTTTVCLLGWLNVGFLFAPGPKYPLTSFRQSKVLVCFLHPTNHSEKTYCQNNLCPPPTPGGEWTLLSVSGGCSNLLLWKMSAALLQKRHLERREGVGSRGLVWERDKRDKAALMLSRSSHPVADRVWPIFTHWSYLAEWTSQCLAAPALSMLVCCTWAAWMPILYGARLCCENDC